MAQKKCPSSDELDRILLDPDSEEARNLKVHIENCPYCRRYLDNKKRKSKTSQTTQADSPDNNQVLVLVSSDWKIVMRAVRNRESGEILIFLIAEDSAICRNVLIKPFGSKKEYITDNQGRINIGKTGWPSDNQLKAELILPKAAFSFELSRKATKNQTSTELKSEQGDRIRISLNERGGSLSLQVKPVKISGKPEEKDIRVAVRNNDKPESWKIASIHEGLAKFEKLPETDSLEIFLYY